MFLDCLQILIPIIGLSANVVVHVISFRYFFKLELMKSVYLGFVFGSLIVFLLELYVLLYWKISLLDFLFISITNFLIYLSLGYCYFHFINLSITARRIRILRVLYETKEGLSLNEIMHRYNAKDMIEIRINRMLNNGQIMFKNNKYFIGKPLMLYMAKLVVMMKFILFNRRSEFE